MVVTSTPSIEGKEIDLCVIGTKAAGFFGSIGVNIIGQVTHIGDEPNPEELIAAAHAGCFNMKLSFVLNEAGFSPDQLNTNAVLTFVDGKVISIELNLEAKVSGISQDKFIELAQDAKNNCPISGALNCEIILNPILT